ncbi:MAG TPA: YsnF/AvaK domain-containing protein [Candidatus Limnocylindria bacterium]|nr:YsnF/AvaK domain-containing protein [Candidatus Limnocylindria bacterium]
MPEDRRRRRRPHTTTAEQVEVAGRGAAEHDEASTQPVDVPAQRLERAEERLVPRVHRADVGEVVVTKHVVEEPETVTVTLAHDKLALQRTGVNRPLEPGEQPITNRGEETLLLVVEERLEVRKVPYVVEEIRLRRQVVREERQVTDTVRKERFDIDPRGAVELREDDG